MKLSESTAAGIALGVDLQLSVYREGRGYVILAEDGEGRALQRLATMVAFEPIVLTHARATAIMLYPDRITEAIQLPEQQPVIRPHPYERGWECKDCGAVLQDHETGHKFARGWHCAHCPMDAHHPIHEKANRAGAAT